MPNIENPKEVFLVLVSYSNSGYIPLSDQAYLKYKDAEKDNVTTVKKLKELHKGNVSFQIKKFQIKSI